MSSNEPPYVVRRRETKRRELIRLPEPVNDLAAHGNGLPVQRGLLERFAIASARAVRTGSPVAVGLVEIQCAKQQEAKRRAADLNRDAGERLRGLLRQTDA